MEIYVLLTILSVTALSVSGQEGQTCADDPCAATHDCTDHGTFVTCRCKNGKEGPNCDMDDPCAPKTIDCPTGMKCFGPCPPNVECLNAMGNPQCSRCIRGMMGENCTDDENECTLGYHTCVNGSTCSNTFGSFKCLCQEGFVGRNCDCAKGSACDKADLIDEQTGDQDKAGSGGPVDGAALPSGTCFMIVTIAGVCHRIVHAL